MAACPSTTWSTPKACSRGKPIRSMRGTQPSSGIMRLRRYRSPQRFMSEKYHSNVLVTHCRSNAHPALLLLLHAGVNQGCPRKPWTTCSRRFTCTASELALADLLATPVHNSLSTLSTSQPALSSWPGTTAVAVGLDSGSVPLEVVFVSAPVLLLAGTDADPRAGGIGSGSFAFSGFGFSGARPPESCFAAPAGPAAGLGVHGTGSGSPEA
mmetsp:Transcript_77267/g.213733  ORF Transcript_77267/g.213733 Transcript_77267/m.213733 type:complete len:211 (+) Transcript_77267:539-1171(+)